jgi:hypothetical protein
MAYMNQRSGGDWREVAYMHDTTTPPWLWFLLHVLSPIDDESAIPRVLKKFVNKASDRTAEVIRLDKDEPIQQEPRLRSRRPRSTVVLKD